jgi:HlyD family secretion protein
MATMSDSSSAPAPEKARAVEETPKAAPARAPAPARLKKRRWGWVVWLVVLAALGVGAWRLAKGRGEAPMAVATTGVQRGSVRDFVTSVAAGRVTAKQEATLRAEIAGRVQKVHVQRGDKVKAGDPLITYDAAELRDRVRIAQAAVGLAQAQVQQADQAKSNVDINLGRAKRLAQTGSVPPAEVENLEGQQSAMTKAADAARAGVSQALANVELARTALSRAMVVAPFSGTILTTTVEVGETTAPGAPILQLADVSALHVDAEIDEADLGRVKVGMPADVTLDAFPGERIRGTLREIAPSVTRDMKGGRSVGVEIALPTDERLRVGMSADVDVIVAVHEHVLFVPPSAVQGRGAERVVYVVKNGVATKRTIDVGISTWEAVEVTRGLDEGEPIVASLSAAPVQDGTKVEAKPGPAAPK